MSWLDRINEQDQADPSFRPSYDTPLPFEGSDVAAGAERGGFGLRSALSGAVGDTHGAEYYGARAAGTPTRFNSYKDVDPLSLDVIDYVQQVGGEQAPNMALMAATGGVAGAAAKSLMAGRVGAGAASGMMQFGEMSNELRQQGLEPTAVTAGAAALGGALDVIGLESLTKGMLKSAVGEQIKSEVQANAATRALRGAFGGFIEGVKNELPAELSQEVLAVGNRAYSDPGYLKKTDEIADRFAETAVATTAFAGPLGAAPGAMGGMRSATPEAPPVTPEASDTSVLDRVRGTPAPSNDMTLEELRALDSSTSSGETYGESQNAAKESTLPPNETGKRQEVLKGAGASAPATSSRAQRAFQYFQDKGLPSHTAAGIVGALTGESSRELSPGIVNPNSGAFGIAQWLGSRVKELDAFAKARGKPVDDFDTQLDFVWHELNNKEAGAFAQVKKAPDALTASDLFTTKFERPGKHELRLEPRRAAALDLLNGKAVGTTQAQAGATTVVQQRAENPALTAAEDAEMARRKTAEEPTYQSTKLGLAYRDGILDGGTEKTGQVDSDDPFRLGATEDEFTLTFKGKKQESRGDDVFKPARPLPETSDDTFEGTTTESTPVRAFTQLYPGAKVAETSDPTDFTKIVSVTLPKSDALDDNAARTAGRVFEALVSGTKDKVEKKIKLEHPDVLSKDSGNPIEIPVTRDGLAKIGRALDPGAYDDKPASAYAAAMSGLTHLIYDKGFVPRGVDTSRPNALEAWVKQQIGEQPVDRNPDMQARLDISKAELSDKQKAHPYFAKDQAKAKKANKFIGRGSPASSTEAYRKAVGAQANTGRYVKDDVVFISAEGNRSGRVPANFAEIDKAVEAGATFVTDVEGHRGRAYNIGEREVADHLVSRGYEEVEPGLWAPSAVQGRTVGTARAEGRTPAPEAGGFTGEDPAPRVEYEQPPLRTATEQKLTSVIGMKAKQIYDDPKSGITVPANIESETDKKNYRWNAAVNRAIQGLNPATVEVPLADPTPTGIVARGKERLRPIMTNLGAPERQGQPDLDQQLLGQVFPTKEEAAVARDQAINQLTEKLVAETEQRLSQAQDAREVESVLDEVARRTVGMVGGKMVGTKAPVFDRKQEMLNVIFDRAESGASEKNRQLDTQAREMLVNEVRTKLSGAGLKTAYALRKTDGGYRVVPAGRVSRPATAEDVTHAAELVKRDFASEQFRQSKDVARAEIGQEAGQNPESMPLRDELSEDQLLADEERIGIAEDRAAMADRAQSLGPAVARSLKWNGIQGLSSDINTTLARQELNPPGHNDPGPAKVADRKKVTDSTKKLEETASLKRELNKQNIETVHKVSGGATIRATGVAEQVVKFFTDALKNIGLEVPLRVMSKAGIAQHIAALDLRIDGLIKAAEDANASLEGMPGVTGEQRKARKEQSKVLELRSRQLMDAMEERKLLQQAQEDEFAARVIYNDHYLDAARRTPVIVISDEAMSSKNLNIVLAHELGHVVQRAWFDQLPADLQKDIIKELSQDGRYTDDIAEAFADRFMEWYRLNERAQKVRNKQNDIQSSGMGKALRRLADALKRLWSNLVGHDNAFARRYPKFDEFLRSTVGVYGRMKPINPRINKLWTESLAQPYGGLPLVAADSTQFNNMTAGEFAQTVVDGAKAGIDRAARYAENKAGENVVGQRYIRKTNETVDAFKKTAAIALMADGTWLRNAGNGILAGYANIVAPIKGRVMKDMQVIGEVLVRPALSAREPAVYASTEAMNGSIQTLSDQQYGAWRKKLDPILAKVSKLSSTDYKSLVEDLRDETAPSKTPIAREIRKYFAEMLMYMRHHDVKVGARSGYYTKAWDQEKLTDNKDAVIESFEKVFAARDELPVDPRVEVREGQESVKFSTPLAAALHEYQRITEGRVDNLFEQTEEDVDPELRGPSFRYARKRMFTNEEYEQFDLNRWLNDDIAWTMNTYTQLGIKRAVQQQATGIPRAQLRNPVSRRYWEQRFTKAKLRPEVMGSPVASLELLLAEGVQDGRLPYDEYVEAKKRIMSVMGLTNVGSNPRWRRWTNRILAYETLLTMTWSSFAQLADFGISVWRADSMDRVGKVIGQIMDKRTRAEQQELLNTIGLSLDELTRHALNSGLMTTDPMAKGTQWLTEKFFKLNGMHFLSESNLMFASMLGQSYIKDYADKAVNAKTLEERDEAMKRLRELHPTLSPADALTGDFAANPLLQQALHEYVSQSHLHNQIGYTPRIFNDYRFAVFTQLKGFMFKYHNIVLRQMWERMKDRPDLLQAAIPMLTLAMATMPLAFVGMEAKEALRRRLFPKVKRAPKDKTPMQKFHDVLMASGMPGAYVGLFDSALEAPQHGQPGIVALAGPTVGHAFNISSRTADEWLPSSVPIVSSVPWIRSMARQGLRDTFGFGVRDEE